MTDIQSKDSPSGASFDVKRTQQMQIETNNSYALASSRTFSLMLAVLTLRALLLRVYQC